MFFGATNFPFAIGVGGSDWVAALAVGCPVVATAHRGHPGTTEMTGRAIVAAAEPEVIRRILRHLEHQLDVPPPAPARAPPFSGDADDASSAHGLPFTDEAEWTPTEEEPC